MTHESLQGKIGDAPAGEASLIVGTTVREGKTYLGLAIQDSEGRRAHVRLTRRAAVTLLLDLVEQITKLPAEDGE